MQIGVNVNASTSRREVAPIGNKNAETIAKSAYFSNKKTHHNKLK